MRKFLFLLLFIAAGTAVFGQIKIGLKVSPGILFNRVRMDSDSLAFHDAKEKFTLPFGLFFDLPINDRYYISTGVNLVMKNPEVTYNFPNNDEYTGEVRLQYLQIPVLLKLYTDEIMIDKRLFFQFGPAFEVLIHNEINDDYISKVLFADISFHFSGGIDIKIGPNTIFTTGVSYQRGLLNVIREPNFQADKYSLKNDLLLLDLGLKL